MDPKELARLFQDMGTREMSYAQELAGLANKFKHPVLQALIYGISHDSEKHRLFYMSLARLLTETTPVLTEEEYSYIKEGIDRHIQMEKDMIEFTSRMLKETDDPRMKLILSALLEDETKHHRLLIALKKTIAEKEKLGEEELWDMVWKESPWHGTPGG